MSGRVTHSAHDASGEEPRRAEAREAFAARLRGLRQQAGSPSFRHLAKLTNYSPSTLADATSGKRLPTEPVLKALVTACGVDPEPWVEDLRRAAAAESHGPSAGAPAVLPAAGGRGARAAWRMTVAAAAVLVTFAGGLVVGFAIRPASGIVGRHADADLARPQAGVTPLAGTPVPAPTARVADGVDPVVGHCVTDARLVDKAPVLLGGVQVGALELVYSARCGAGWARLYLYPGQPTMMGQVTVHAGDGRLVSFADPLVRQIADYTDVVVPGRGGCLGAEAIVYSAGKAAVSASIPCEPPTARGG